MIGLLGIQGENLSNDTRDKRRQLIEEKKIGLNNMLNLFSNMHFDARRGREGIEFREGLQSLMTEFCVRLDKLSKNYSKNVVNVNQKLDSDGEID